MKRAMRITSALILSFLFLTASFVFANDNWNYLVLTADWQKFSNNLEKAIDSKNTGLQTSAMQMVIKYGDKVDVDNSVIKLVRFYRISKDERVRQLALVSLYSMQNDWALGIIKRNKRGYKLIIVYNVNYYYNCARIYFCFTL